MIILEIELIRVLANVPPGIDYLCFRCPHLLVLGKGLDSQSRLAKDSYLCGSCPEANVNSRS